MSLRPEIQAAAEWLEKQLDDHPFAEAGFSVAQHQGLIQRIDYTLTEKVKPSETGGAYGTQKRRR